MKTQTALRTAACWPVANGRQCTLAPPLLSAYTAAADSRSLWALAGLARFGWGKTADSQHVAPRSCQNPGTETMISPVVARWKTDGLRQVSFLWRAFRHRRDHDGTKADLLLGREMK